jgi:hypothetical protein
MPILDCFVQNGSSTEQFPEVPHSIVFLGVLVLAARFSNSGIDPLCELMQSVVGAPIFKNR